MTATDVVKVLPIPAAAAAAKNMAQTVLYVDLVREGSRLSGWERTNEPIPRYSLEEGVYLQRNNL
jgi:hypothetical protein